MQMVEYTGGGLRPVGYGYRSIEAIIQTVLDLEAGKISLDAIDQAGLLATPANSRYNERVVEAARRSIAEGGSLVSCA